MLTSSYQGLATPPTAQPWICPRLVSLNVDGCTALDWDSLRTLVESRLPTNSRGYCRPSIGPPGVYSHPPPHICTASRSAALQAFPVSHSAVTAVSPQRLVSIDVTRCHQISREMVQWLRMYVADVKCEPAKGLWGEPVLP